MTLEWFQLKHVAIALFMCCMQLSVNGPVQIYCAIISGVCKIGQAWYCKVLTPSYTTFKTTYFVIPASLHSRCIACLLQQRFVYIIKVRALTRWALWTGELSYSRVSGFGICGAARPLDQGA